MQGGKGKDEGCTAENGKAWEVFRFCVESKTVRAGEEDAILCTLTLCLFQDEAIPQHCSFQGATQHSLTTNTHTHTH